MEGGNWQDSSSILPVIQDRSRLFPTPVRPWLAGRAGVDGGGATGRCPGVRPVPGGGRLGGGQRGGPGAGAQELAELLAPLLQPVEEPVRHPASHASCEEAQQRKPAKHVSLKGTGGQRCSLSLTASLRDSSTAA